MSSEYRGSSWIAHWLLLDVRCDENSVSDDRELIVTGILKGVPPLAECPLRQRTALVTSFPLSLAKGKGE